MYKTTIAFVRRLSFLFSLFFLYYGFLCFHGNMYRGLDGSYFCWLRDLIKENNYNILGLSLSHYQGNSAAQFPLNLQNNLTFLLSLTFPFKTKTSVYMASSLVVLIVSIIISKILKLLFFEKLLFSVLCFATLLPWPLGFYGLADCSPVMPEFAMLFTLSLVLLFQDKKNTKTYLYILLIYFYLLFITPAFLIFLIPLLTLFFHEYSKNILNKSYNIFKSDNFIYFVSIAGLFLICFWALGHSLTTPTYFFKDQIKDALSYEDVSFIFWPGKKLPAVGLIVMSYLLALINLNNRENQIIFSFSKFVLIFLFFQVTLMFLIKNKIIETRIVSLTYFEYLILPAYMIILISIFDFNLRNQLDEK